MIFGRQNNLTRRAVRPDGRFTREVRRRRAGRASLLDITTAGPPQPGLLGRLFGAVLRVFRR